MRRRDPRASLYVVGDDFWSYVVLDGTAELTPVAADPADETVDDLVALYRAGAGEHPDWDEFRRDMVADSRLVVHLHFDHAYGMGGSLEASHHELRLLVEEQAALRRGAAPLGPAVPPPGGFHAVCGGGGPRPGGPPPQAPPHQPPRAAHLLAGPGGRRGPPLV